MIIYLGREINYRDFSNFEDGGIIEKGSCRMLGFLWKSLGRGGGWMDRVKGDAGILG